MILENSKQKYWDNFDLLRWLMALVFISAGLFRVFNYSYSQVEMTLLKLPEFFIWFILFFEIFAGVLLIVKKIWVKKILIALIAFLGLSLGWALVINGQEIIQSYQELFVFDLTPTDFFLHFVFLIILLSILKQQRS